MMEKSDWLHPQAIVSESELVERYLKKKVGSAPSIIPEFHLDDFDPLNLTAAARREQGEWYLFSRKHHTREGKSGYWEETATEEAVTADGGTREVGLKRTFTFFYKMFAEDVKTWWVMDEYSLLDNNDWVLCRIYTYWPSFVDIALECARLQHRFSFPPLKVQGYPRMPDLNHVFHYAIGGESIDSLEVMQPYESEQTPISVHYNQEAEEHNVSTSDSMESLEFVEASHPMFGEPLRWGEEQETQECGFAATSLKTVQYNQNEHQHTQEQHQVQECNIATSNSKKENGGERIIEEHNVAASDSMESLEFVEASHPMFGEPLRSDEEQETPECGFAATSLKTVQYNQNEHQHTQEQHQVQECNIATSNSNKENRGEGTIEERNVAASDSKGKEKGKRKACLHLSLERLEPHFGKKLEDVAKELGVGRSTIKRACRDYGIDRWPSKKTHKMNPSLFQRQSGEDSHQETKADHVIVEEEAEKVIVKVQYEEDIVKLEFCPSSGVSKLFEKVATKFNLEVGAFKLKYMDEDDDDILLISDDDFKLCRKSQITMDKTCIKLFVRR